MFIELVKKYFWVFFVSMVPLIELRGAVPIGVGMQLEPTWSILLVAVIGNMVPVPIILLFAKKVLLWCCTWPGKLGKFFGAIHSKGVKASNKIQEKSGKGIYYGLFLFVAIPLPGTGAWTGCLGATLLDLKFWPSVLSVLAGVITAGIIMLVLSSLGFMVLVH